MSVMATTDLGVCFHMLLLLGLFPGVLSQVPCASAEEGGIVTRAFIVGTPFSSYGYFLHINGESIDVGHCASNGICSNNDSSRFQVFVRNHSNPVLKIVALVIDEVHRNMTLIQFYRNKIPIVQHDCPLKVYVTPMVPSCVGPEFVQGDTELQMTCTSARVYPLARCEFRVLAGNVSSVQAQLLDITEFSSDSPLYPGDKQLTCQLRVSVSGLPEDPYKFRALFYPDIGVDLSEMPDSTLAFGEQTEPISLRAIALFQDDHTGHSFEFPASGELAINIHVYGNPNPNEYSCTVRYDGTSNYVTVPDTDYTVSYTSKVAGRSGVITLTIKKGVKKHLTSYFLFTAGNGVVGPSEFEYAFSVKQTYRTPSRPECEGPDFVNGNTEVQIKCKVNRVYPSGRCDFKQLQGQKISDEYLKQTTSSVDSGTFPGDQEVTCLLQISLLDIAAGDFQFRVEASPDLQGLPASATTAGDALPMLHLQPLSLFNPSENNQTLPYPESGEVTVDVEIVGVPEPNRFRLAVTEEGSSKSNPVPSRDYQRTYEKRPGMNGGVLKLTISGGLPERGRSLYTVKADNGVAGSEAFEYRFYVEGKHLSTLPSNTNKNAQKKDDNDDNDDNDDDVPIIIGITVIGLIVILALIVALVIAFRRQRQRQQQRLSVYYNATPRAGCESRHIYPNMAFSNDYVGPSSGSLPPPYHSNDGGDEPRLSTFSENYAYATDEFDEAELPRKGES